MTRKRQPGAQIELRRLREEFGGSESLGRRLYLVALALMAVIVVASLALELLTAIRPSHLPIKELKKSR